MTRAASVSRLFIFKRKKDSMRNKAKTVPISDALTFLEQPGWRLIAGRLVSSNILPAGEVGRMSIMPEEIAFKTTGGNFVVPREHLMTDVVFTTDGMPRVISLRGPQPANVNEQRTVRITDVVAVFRHLPTHEAYIEERTRVAEELRQRALAAARLKMMEEARKTLAAKHRYILEYRDGTRLVTDVQWGLRGHYGKGFFDSNDEGKTWRGALQVDVLGYSETLCFYGEEALSFRELGKLYGRETGELVCIPLPTGWRHVVIDPACKRTLSPDDLKYIDQFDGSSSWLSCLHVPQYGTSTQAVRILRHQ